HRGGPLRMSVSILKPSLSTTVYASGTTFENLRNGITTSINLVPDWLQSDAGDTYVGLPYLMFDTSDLPGPVVAAKFRTYRVFNFGDAVDLELRATPFSNPVTTGDYPPQFGPVLATASIPAPPPSDAAGLFWFNLI